MDYSYNSNKKPDKRQIILKALAILLIALGLDLLVSGLLSITGLFDGTMVSVASNMLEGFIAAAAAGLVIYEIRVGQIQESRENDIQEAIFLLNYNQSFIQDKNMNTVEYLLEKQMSYGYTGSIITEENRQMFINYLVYLEGLAPLVLNDIMKLDHIDDLMAFRFFLAVNNPELQKDQLVEFPQFYRGCFKLYRKWNEYYDEQTRKGNKREVPFKETGLDKLACYEEYSRID